jgi:hypothetical protein
MQAAVHVGGEHVMPVAEHALHLNRKVSAMQRDGRALCAEMSAPPLGCMPAPASGCLAHT